MNLGVEKAILINLLEHFTLYATVGHLCRHVSTGQAQERVTKRINFMLRAKEV